MTRYPPEFSTTGALSTLYRTWYDMSRRCSPTERPDSRHYFYKGVRVCEAWSNWPAFAEWALANGWKRGLEIDRKNNDEGYSPGNCRFVTHIEQNLNRDLARAHRGIREAQARRWARPFRCIETGEVFSTQIEAQRRHGVDRKSLRHALRGKYQQAGGYRWTYVGAL